MMEHKRIWIERDDECPYFYTEEELADAAPPLVEYRIASSDGATVWRYIRPIAGTDPTIGYTENESLAREYEKFGPVDPLFPVERIAELERGYLELAEKHTALIQELAAAQATISRMREALTVFTSIYFEERHRAIAQEALALPADRTALDAILAEARLEERTRAAGIADKWGGTLVAEEMRQAAERGE